MNQAITERMMGYKIHILVIMSLERSDKLAKERNHALALMRHLVMVGIPAGIDG